jgi:hypothetical protein
MGLTLPRLPQQADEATAVYYLLSGSVLLSLGLFSLAQKVKGAFLTRFLIVFLFFFACFGISVSLESSIYSSAEGYDLMILVLLLPIILFSFTSTSLTKSQSLTETFSQRSIRFFKSKTLGEWACRSNDSFISFGLFGFWNYCFFIRCGLLPREYLWFENTRLWNNNSGSIGPKSIFSIGDSSDNYCLVRKEDSTRAIARHGTFCDCVFLRHRSRISTTRYFGFDTC